jgi:hypothetical protein
MESNMPSWVLFFTVIEFFSLPAIGAIALTLSKVTAGDSARIAERWFLGVLLAVTLITCRTVIVLDNCWLAHTATLGFMIVGALLVPSRDSLDQRRTAVTWR